MKEIDLPPIRTEISKDLPPKPANKRRRTKQTVGLEERLALRARHDRDRARSLPPGEEQEHLLRRARRTEQATQMTEWLTTPSSKRKM